ncbi:MAG: amidase family protein, partial [Anaeromyxobacteraceae bacterium]
AALAGRDARDPSSTRAPPGLARLDAQTVKGLRVAVLPFPDEYAIHPALPVFYEQALGALRAAGLGLERATLPDLPWRVVSDVILEAEAAVAFEELIRSGGVKDLSDPCHHAHGGRSYVVESLSTDYVKAQAVRAAMQREMATFFRRYDLIVSPNSPILPPGVDDPLPAEGGTIVQYAGNVLGLPATALPMGFLEPGHLPASLQLVGPARADARVLAAAAAFQSQTRWHAARPVI